MKLMTVLRIVFLYLLAVLVAVVLAVVRRDTEALITLDRLRIDVKAEFYVRVKPDAQSIAIAAQTLGMRTMNPEALKELVEGKFVDALRSVAAGMTMNELHEQRADFVQKVQQASSNDLAMNGLELESVSLTGLDQTSIPLTRTELKDWKIISRTRDYTMYRRPVKLLSPNVYEKLQIILRYIVNFFKNIRQSCEPSYEKLKSERCEVVKIS